MSLDDMTRTFRTKTEVCECEGCVSDFMGPCWVFSSVDRYGYARFKHNGTNKLAHRFSYERLVGDIPDDYDIDHLCDRHRNCVNPAHMEPVPKSINAQRANERRWRTNKEQST